MRTIYGLLGISLLLFLSSIWFLVLGVRGPVRPPQAEPVASVKQLMTGIITTSHSGSARLTRLAAPLASYVTPSVSAPTAR